MQKPLIDLTNQRFRHLVAVSYLGNRRWLCRCDCGMDHVVRGDKLCEGNTTNCGCKRGPGYRNVPGFFGWRNMIMRCTVPTAMGYQRYGGRGITVCPQWLASFPQFAADMGPRPSPRHTIDRIDNDKGYAPDNCRWATRIQQARNRSSNVVLSFQGNSWPVSQWAERIGVSAATIHYRIRRQLPIDKILSPKSPRASTTR